MTQLNVAVGVAGHYEEAAWMRPDIGYFRGVQATVLKYTATGSGKTAEELDAQIAQIVSQAVTSVEVIDIFGTAGIPKPDISILSEEFLAKLKSNPLKNLQVEMLRKLWAGEIKLMGDRNVVQSRKFSEMLDCTMKTCQNRSIEAAEVLLQLIDQPGASGPCPSAAASSA